MTAAAPLPLSVFIIAQDEADRIGDAIRAVRDLSDDVVLVDSGSTDGTPAVAAGLGARVIHHPWPGYGPQKRFAEEQCRHEWLLNLDADEVVPPELEREIRALFAAGEPQSPAYRIEIAEIFPGEDRPHSWAYTLTPVRLYRRDAGRYSAALVHDRVELNAGIRAGHLRGVIHHFSVRSLGDQLDKLNRYSDQQAHDLELRERRDPDLAPVLRVPGEFRESLCRPTPLRPRRLRFPHRDELRDLPSSAPREALRAPTAGAGPAAREAASEERATPPV